MRWIAAVVALLVAAWLLRDGRRRARVQDMLRNTAGWNGRDDGTGAPLGDMTAGARAKVTQMQATWPRMVSRVADLTTKAGGAVTQGAQGLSRSP